MKINWGTGIVIGFVLFISFIMYFVINMATDKKYQYELVAEDYYKQELAYQNEIDLEQKTVTDNMQLNLQKTKEGLKVYFPSHLDSKKITGTIFLYRPSNERLDFKLPLGISGNHLLIPKKRLVDGRWNMKVVWQYNGEPYLFKKDISY